MQRLLTSSRVTADLLARMVSSSLADDKHGQCAFTHGTVCVHTWGSVRSHTGQCVPTRGSVCSHTGQCAFPHGAVYVPTRGSVCSCTRQFVIPHMHIVSSHNQFPQLWARCFHTQGSVFTHNGVCIPTWCNTYIGKV